jgi:hypothetical protein
MEGKTALDCETIDGRADMSAPLDEDAAPLPSVVAASLSILWGGNRVGWTSEMTVAGEKREKALEQRSI